MMLDSLLPTLDEDTSSGGGGPSLGLGSAVIECYFLMALYWSLGATLIEESRVKFDSFVKRLASMTEVPGTGAVAGPEQIPIHYPTLYEYKFDPEQLKWVPWVDLVPEYEHKLGMKFHEILVPTVDTVRNTWLLELMVKIRRPVVFVGETGTSKTATIQNFLRGLDPDTTVSRVSLLHMTVGYSIHKLTLLHVHICITLQMLLNVNFSSRTTSMDVQRNLEANVEKRMKDTYGPPPGESMVTIMCGIDTRVVEPSLEMTTLVMV